MSEPSWATICDVVVRDGVDAAVAGLTGADARTSALRRVLEREAHHLRGAGTTAGMVLQQGAAGAHAIGEPGLEAEAVELADRDRRLLLQPVWRTGAPGPSLARTLILPTRIDDLTFGPDDTLYVAAGGTLTAWDAATGLPAVVPALDGQVESVAVAPSGAAAVGLRYGRILLLDLPSGSVRAELDAGTGDVHRLRHLPDGGLVCAGEDHLTRIWAPDRTLRHVLEAHDGWIHALAASPDGTTVVTGSFVGTTRVWDVATGRCRQVVEGYPTVRGASYTRRGDVLVTCCDDGEVRRYDVVDGLLHRDRAATAPRTTGPGPDTCWDVAHTGQGQAVVATRDALVDLWPARSRPWTATASLAGHASRVRRVAVSPDDRWTASGDDAGLVLIRETAHLDRPAPGPGPGSYFCVDTIAVSRSARTLASAPQHMYEISVRDLHTGRERLPTRATRPERTSAGLDRLWYSGSALTGAAGSTLLHVTAFPTVHTQNLGAHVIAGLDGHVLTAAAGRADDGTAGVRLSLTSADGAPVRLHTDLPDTPDPEQGAFTSDLTCVVVGGERGGTQQGLRLLTCWRPHDRSVFSVGVPEEGADGSRIAAVAVDDEGCHAIGAGDDGRAHIWDLRTGALTTMRGDPVELIGAVGQGDHRAATVGHTGELVLWDLTTPTALARAPLDCRATALAADGPVLAVGDQSGNTHVLVVREGAPDSPPPGPAASPATPSPATPTPRRGLLDRLLGR
jgi:WD40 repeat protein